jgi:hypothetical protein
VWSSNGLAANPINLPAGQLLNRFSRKPYQSQHWFGNIGICGFLEPPRSPGAGIVRRLRPTSTRRTKPSLCIADVSNW